MLKTTSAYTWWETQISSRTKAGIPASPHLWIGDASALLLAATLETRLEGGINS